MKTYILITYNRDRYKPGMYYQTQGNTPEEAAEAWAAWLLEDRAKIDNFIPTLRIAMIEYHLDRVLLMEVTNKTGNLLEAVDLRLDYETYEVKPFEMPTRSTKDYM